MVGATESAICMNNNVEAVPNSYKSIVSCQGFNIVEGWDLDHAGRTTQRLRVITSGRGTPGLQSQQLCPLEKKVPDESRYFWY